VQDMRLVTGAPRMWDQVNAIEPPGRQFWDPVSFMPAEDRTRRMMDNFLDGQGGAARAARDSVDGLPFVGGEMKEREIETGHDREAPGLVPWRIFQNAAGVTSLVWIFAGVYWMMRATNMVNKDWKMWLGAEPEDADEGTTFVDLRHSLELPESSVNLTSWRSLEGPVPATWPYPSMAPGSLTCDASGRHLLVVDGVSLYHADLTARPRRAPAHGKATSLLAGGRETAMDVEAVGGEANFAAITGCDALRGQALDDAAIACGGEQQCEIIVLHGHGRRITSCLLGAKGGGDQANPEVRPAVASTSLSAPIAFQWLHKGESMRWIVVDPDCIADVSVAGAAVKAGCVSVATSHGRVAQLELSALSGQLNPDEVFDASKRSKRHSGKAKGSAHVEVVRAMGSGAVGLLDRSGHDVRVVDRASMTNGDRLTVARVRLPIAEVVRSFCVGGGELFMLEQGSSPKLVRFPFKKSLGHDLLLDYGSTGHVMI